MISDVHPPDEHALFPHFIVTTSRIQVNRTPKGKVISREPIESIFIVCARCKCWPEREVRNCQCPSTCHVEVSEVLAQRRTRR